MNIVSEKKKNKTWERIIKDLCLILFFLVIVTNFSKLVIADPPSPHNVKGRIFTNGSNGVQNGIPVFINNTANGESVNTEVYAPPIPQFRGSYSTTINGNDGDLVIVTSWNDTHYGINSATLESTTTTIDVYLNTTRPSEANVTIILPLNNSVLNTTDLFNVTANITILGNDGTNCNATITLSNDAANITSDQLFTNQLGDINLHQSVTTTWNVTGIKEGILDIIVTAQCSSDGVKLENLNSDQINISIVDTTDPLVNLITPINNSWLNGNITFEYNVSENTGIADCSLYFDGVLNQTTYNPPTDTLLNFTLNNTVEGSYDWFISCFDNSSNSNNGQSELRTLYIDRTAPNVSILLPANNSVISSYINIFRYNVTDNFNVSNCSLIIDNQVVTVNYSITQNISNNFTYSLTGGNFNWTVNCSDSAGNIGYTGYHTLKSPDLKVNSSDVVFSKTNVSEREIIEINITVFNIGDVNLTNNVTIQLFESDPNVNGAQIGNNYSVNITAGNNITLTFSYTTRIGTVYIFAIVDPIVENNGSIIEFDETNNKANKSIIIPPYHTFYGDIVSDIFLDTTSVQTVIAWINATEISGNIFVADSDSNVDFNNLHALSRNLSNNLTIDDFEELDKALNLTNVSDSLNRTYTKDGIVRNSDNFTIYSDYINYTPIINSTNSTDFITGILWDKSDENNGQFNGSQDVVFVSRINKRSIGYYGLYDYEIKVPANLRKYVVPNDEDSVTFYVEIT